MYIQRETIRCPRLIYMLYVVVLWLYVYIYVSMCIKYISLEILADWEIEKSEWQANVGYQTERIFGLIDS